MKQKLLLSGLAVSTVGITSYLLKDPSNRQKAREFIHSMKMKITKQPDMETFPVDKAGHPPARYRGQQNGIRRLHVSRPILR